MSEFKQRQADIQQARKDRIEKANIVFRSSEKLKKLQRAKKKVTRSHPKDSPLYQQLAGDEKKLTENLAKHQQDLKDLLDAELGHFEAFIPFTDPRHQINQLSDNIPILLFPVRLETRFKTIASGDTAPQRQLWVRVFPDDCSIDTFNDVLSESEISKARSYWTTVWKAGAAGNEDVKPYVENKRRGAWRDLMGVFKAGRAYWVEQHYVPDNQNDIPVRNDETDILIVIATETLPTADKQNALSTYWEAFLLARDDSEQITSAFAALVTSLGGDEAANTRALELIDIYRPDNIGQLIIDPETDPAIQVAFLLFPKSKTFDSKLAAWSNPAKVTTLPERFVLLGFQEGIEEPVIEEIGNHIPDPLIVGPDPGEDIDQVLRDVFGDEFEALSDDDKAQKYIEYLSSRSATKWLFDFDEAIDNGMGFKVDISESVYQTGLTRLFVLGVKLSADETEAQALLEQLFRNHHFGDSGLAILPQGAATNNTEDSPSAYSQSEDPDEAYDRYHSDNGFDDPDERNQKLDGRWLAELLGIDRQQSALNLVSGYRGTDQCEARAMNTALWRATIGYFMESMLTPVFNDRQRELTRWFLINYVSGRGRLPAIRIGQQPYGILPISKVSDLAWLDAKRIPVGRQFLNPLRFLQGLYSVIKTVRDDWSSLLEKVAYVGKEGDGQKILLQALGLHANSVEFDQRYAESFDHLYNRLRAEGFDGSLKAMITEFRYNAIGMVLLARLGYVHDQELNPEIPILSKYFLTKEYDVTKPTIDDQELSETGPIRVYTTTDQNYIEWLIENARNNHRNIRDQKGFIDNKRPYALLYDMLRHALNLEFADTGLKLYLNAEILSTAQVAQAKVDAPFIGIQAQNPGLESKWDLIYRADNRIATGNTLIVNHISDLLKSAVVNQQTGELQEVIAALEHLKATPTARLDRAFVEHLDCCTYRLDAWLLGLVNFQLEAMRYGLADSDADFSPGVYLGAFGWLENLKPDEKEFTPVGLSPELEAIFNPAGDNAPQRDSTNAGYVHAPSINHGTTSAVLRNAYISIANEEAAEPYKVNLSSERVRVALSIIEGIQQGQNLAALLGYQLERGLHDNHNLELDTYIYELRKVFPLNSNKIILTAIKLNKLVLTPAEQLRQVEEKQELEEDKAVTKIEARNVVNGLALIDHIRDSVEKDYPFGFPTGTGVGKLKAADSDIRDAINAEVRRLENIRDAVADLAMAEGVHQVVQGNYDRGSAAMDSYSKGAYPQQPEVVKSNNSGVSLTHRFGIHLPASLTPADTENPRVRIEPAINAWLADLFPDLNNVQCHLEYQFPDYQDGAPNPVVEKTVQLSQLGLAPIDILFMLNVEQDKSLSALDDYLLKILHDDDSPRPDVEINIRYTTRVGDTISFFELVPLVDSLCSLIFSARPLQANDVALQNEAAEGEVSSNLAMLDSLRVTKARQDLEQINSDIKTDVVDELGPFIDAEDFEITMTHRDDIINRIDTVIDDFIRHQASLSLFGIAQSGFGFVYDRKAAIYKAVYEKLVAYKKRWVDREEGYRRLLDNQFPAATTPEQQIATLQEAERLISTQLSIPVPPIPNYQSDLALKKTAFDAKLVEIQNFLDGKFLTPKSLLDKVNSIIANLADFDFEVLDIANEERQAVVFAEDIYNQTDTLVEFLTDLTGTVQSMVSDAEADGEITSANKTLLEATRKIFGENFVFLPEFTLGPDQANELRQCYDHQAQLLDYQTSTLSNDFPVDDWLYGVARVREKMAAWENLVVIAEGMKNRDSIDLNPIQLPYAENDHWLGLSYPEAHVIESDKLLYTGYMPDFDSSKSQCGLMVDEWTEIIPQATETTGLCFHFDQPNSEPPQSLLLVTPAEFTGEWKWSDLVDTLHDTLDLARLRAVEPDHIDQSDYARFLPATVAAVTTYPVTIALNYIMAAGVTWLESGGNNG